MVLTSDDAPAREGRVARTALLGFLAAMSGSNVLEDPANPLRTVLTFVLALVVTGALIVELNGQARRRQVGGVTGWAGTDTAIVVVLSAYATLLCVAAAVQDLPPSEEVAAPGFAGLYVVLAGGFSRVRRRSMSGNTLALALRAGDVGPRG